MYACVIIASMSENTSYGSDLPVLVGVDGSSASMKAVWYAANYAKHANLPLDIVSIMPPMVEYTDGRMEPVAPPVDILKQSKTIALNQHVPLDSMRTLYATGDSIKILIEMSEHADIIVLGSRGEGGFIERIMGTMSSTLPAKAACPVVIVPAFDDNTHEPFHFNNTINNIAVAVNENPEGERALDMACELASDWNSCLHICMAKTGENAFNDVSASMFLQSKQGMLNGITHDIHIIHGNIVDMMLSLDADMLVVGSRGLSGLAGLIRGSVSQTLIEKSRLPVYVIPVRYVYNSYDWKRARLFTDYDYMDAVNTVEV